ncbi:MAG: type II toxin-antitoxin system Phd/YefM family antitoxin [Candidatus Ornithomonoglobus sp.]
MNQMSVMGMMKSIVPITRFNKGEASKIFDEVENAGTKIVMKNNKPACVLLSPNQYESLMEMLSDYLLLAEAEKRMENNNASENIRHEDLLREIGVTEEELAEIDVEIE